MSFLRPGVESSQRDKSHVSGMIPFSHQCQTRVCKSQQSLRFIFVGNLAPETFSIPCYCFGDVTHHTGYMMQIVKLLIEFIHHNVLKRRTAAGSQGVGPGTTAITTAVQFWSSQSGQVLDPDCRRTTLFLLLVGISCLLNVDREAGDLPHYRLRGRFL